MEEVTNQAIWSKEVETGKIDGYEYFTGTIVNSGMTQLQQFILAKDDVLIILNFGFSKEAQLNEFGSIVDTLTII